MRRSCSILTDKHCSTSPRPHPPPLSKDDLRQTNHPLHSQNLIRLRSLRVLPHSPPVVLIPHHLRPLPLPQTFRAHSSRRSHRHPIRPREVHPATDRRRRQRRRHRHAFLRRRPRQRCRQRPRKTCTYQRREERGYHWVDPRRRILLAKRCQRGRWARRTVTCGGQGRRGSFPIAESLHSYSFFRHHCV